MGYLCFSFCDWNVNYDNAFAFGIQQSDICAAAKTVLGIHYHNVDPEEQSIGPAFQNGCSIIELHWKLDGHLVCIVSSVRYRTNANLWYGAFVRVLMCMSNLKAGLTKIGPNSNGNMNFRTVSKALVLLFRMTCGEAWNEIMSDYEVHEPSCVRGETFFESDCGSETYARALFVSWNILSMYIFVSMVRLLLKTENEITLTTYNSSSRSYSKVFLTSIKDRATLRRSREKSFENSNKPGPSLIRKALDTSQKMNFLVFWLIFLVFLP